MSARSSRWLLLIVALLVLVPMAEIAVLILVGQQIGALWTILLMLGTSLVGGWLLRREGTKAWLRVREAMEQGRPPGREATDGLLVLIGGIFMLVPGFVSDVLGLLLILPPTRALWRGLVLRAAASRMSPQLATQVFGPRRVRVKRGASRPYHPEPEPPATPPPALEGEILPPAPGTRTAPPA